MLRANELMIGDWVKFPGGAIDKIVDLPFIEGKGLCASFAASATLFPFPIEKIEPIPLTPEILEKNFQKPNVVAWWPSEVTINDEHCLYHCEGAGKLIGFSGEFRYVHELQNCMKAVGCEKEIEL